MNTTLAPFELSFSTGQLFLSFSLAFALAFLSATLYRRVHTGPAYTYSFYVTLIVLPVIVCMIMMAIGSNIALSLGLVGALSIVRFRTAIKDSRDMGYLFWGVAIGLCCGAGEYALAIAGSGFAGAVILGVHWAGSAGIVDEEYLLIFRRSGTADREHESFVSDLVRWRKLQTATDLGQGQGCEYTYRLRLARGASPEQLLDRLRNADNLLQPTLISPESQVAV